MKSFTLTNLLFAISALSFFVALPTYASVCYISNGCTATSSFVQGWIYSNGGTGALAASSSPTVASITATSTATSTFAGPVLIFGGAGIRQRIESSAVAGINEVLQLVDTANTLVNRGVKIGMYTAAGSNSNQLGAEIISAVDSSGANNAYLSFTTRNAGAVGEVFRLTPTYVSAVTPLVDSGDLSYEHAPGGNASISTLSSFVVATTSNTAHERQFMSSFELRSNTGQSDTGNVGDRVAIYASVVATSSGRFPGDGDQSGDVWVFNPLMSLATSSGTYNAQMFELDMNNHNHDSTAAITELYPAGTKRAGGITLTGVSTLEHYANDYGVSIETAGAYNTWNKGFAVSDARQAAFWNNSGATYAFYTGGSSANGFYENGSNASAVNYFKHATGFNTSTPAYAIDVAGGDINIDTGKFYRANGTGVLGVDTSQDTILRGASGKGIGFATNAATLAANGSMYLSSNGNVNIGLTSNHNKAIFHVTATSSLSTQPLLSFETPTPDALATSSVFWIDAYGRQGIGTTTPVAKLDVYSSVASTTPLLLESISGGGCAILKDVAGTGYTQIYTQAGQVFGMVHTGALTSCN